MPHGYPDWGGASPQIVSTPVSDLGELAARLGSVDRINRQGYVVAVDDFSNGLQTIGAYVNGAGSYRELTRDYFAGRGWSVHLYADGTAGAFAGLSAWSAIPVAGRAGVEWLVGFDFNIEFIQMQNNGYTPGHSYVGAVRFDYPNHKLQYYSAAGVWTDFASNIYPSITKFVFHSFKLVIDSQNGKYVKFILDAQTFDLSGIILFDGGAPLVTEMAAILEQFSLLGTPSDAYVGGVVLTINEP